MAILLTLGAGGLIYFIAAEVISAAASRPAIRTNHRPSRRITRA
jgi:hypothetical protein